jgi:hypothetical protein
MENPYKRKLLEDEDEGDREPSKRRGQDKKKQKYRGLKTNEAKQQSQANKRQKVKRRQMQLKEDS